MERSEYLTHRARQKKRRIWLVIALCLLLLPVLTFLETRVFQLGQIPFPVSGNVLVFVLININVILLLLVVFLVLRNLVQLVFERRRHYLGSKLRSKLVISFVSLSLIPTGLLFFISLQFVSTSMDYWFNINVEQSLEESLNIAKNVYDKARGQVTSQGKSIGIRLESQIYQDLISQHLDLFLTDISVSHGLAGLELISEQRTPIMRVFGVGINKEKVPEMPAELMRRALEGEAGLVAIQAVEEGELVRGLTPVRLGQAEPVRYNLLITSLLIKRQQLEGMDIISKGLEGYRQLMILKNPIKTSLLVMLLIVTLLIVFSAIWFGFYVARGLTGPISKLADATRRVAEGELDFVLDKESGDEMGTLVDSFNRMTRDLLTSKKQLVEVNKALQFSNQALENRRQYMETILQNVAAGVVSMDEKGCFTTINRFAEDLLKINKNEVIGRHYREVLRSAHLEIMEGFFAELDRSDKATIQHNVRLSFGNQSFSLRISFTQLQDDEKNNLGVVLVFDNLTELEKAQRMAAWREVARRIAHEVKNPLTPIQLSAQRLRKRYLDVLDQEGEVFDSCTQTIINQVEELKRLVSEFSSFARMPAVEKSPNSLLEMAEEVLVLYREGHKDIDFMLIGGGDLPIFSFDVTQMKRVLINLLDNAVAAVGQHGIIEVELYSNPKENSAFIEVRDNGIGVKDEDKLRLFEPYFSTKKTGTGLGLAIAATVVADHGGYIRVKDNKPQGAIFIIEMPMAGV